MDSRFGSIDGVLQTVVGYTGGEKENPTYRRMGDHTESVQIVFDPQRVSYEELLAAFWSSHDPRSNSWSRQYRNAIFYHGEEQKKLALNTREQQARDLKAEVETVVATAGTFYPAEGYHQKYLLRAHLDLYRELRAPYPTDDGLVASTAAARVNGYLGGYGSREQLDAEIDRLGLSDAGQDRLRTAVQKR